MVTDVLKAPLTLEKGSVLQKGKSKTLYSTDHEDYLIAEFRDDATAFNSVKKASFAGKGRVNNYFNAFIMQRLAAEGIPTHFIRIRSENEAIVRRLDMLPVECVVRNVAAGSICKRLGVEEGLTLEPPVFEFFLKDDEKGDPFINASHIRSFGWATSEQVEQMRTFSKKVNRVLKPIFAAADLILVDYKLEFGVVQGQVVLGDEFSPDGCRIWDAKSREHFDKDLFRLDIGDLVTGYEAVAQRLGVELPV